MNMILLMVDIPESPITNIKYLDGDTGVSVKWTYTRGNY